MSGGVTLREFLFGEIQRVALEAESADSLSIYDVGTEQSPITIIGEINRVTVERGDQMVTVIVFDEKAKAKVV